MNTYNTLIAAIQAWVEDDDAEFVGEINDVVDLGEKRLLRDLDLAIFRRTDSTATLTIGTPTVTKATISAPNLRVATKAVWLTGGDLTGPVFLERRSQEYLVFYNSGAANGVPKYIADADETTFYFSPPPDATYTVNERYLSRPTPLASGNQSNWLSTHAYDILFKACLAEAEAFLKADNRKSVWDMDYEASLPAARRELYNLFGNQYDQLGAVPIPQGPRSQG